MIAPIYFTLTPNCYKVSFQYHPMLVKCIRRVPSAHYVADGKFWEVGKQDVVYLQKMSAWAQSYHFVSTAYWLEDKEPVQTYEELPIPELTVPHNLLIEPYEYQREGIAYALEKKRCILGDEQGLGKSQPLDSLVCTPFGFVRMGDVYTGMPICGADGNNYRIEAIYPQGELDVYRVTFSDGSSCECSKEHLWNVRDENRRRRGTGWATKTLGEILESGIYLKASEKRLASGGHPVPKYEIPMAEPVNYQWQKYIIPPYTMGAIIGDGAVHKCSSISFSLPKEKEPIIDRITDELYHGLGVIGDCRRKVHRYFITKSTAGNAINIYTAELRRMNLDVLSFDKFIPDEYLLGSIEQRKALLNGLMDTDGSCIKNRTCYSTTSKRLADDVVMLVRSLGGIATIAEYYQDGKSVEYRVNVNTPFCPFSSEIYKAKEWQPRKAFKVTRYITGIEPIGKKECQCIKVSAPDSLYITNDFIVTHNTVEAIGVLTASKAFPALVVCPASLKINWQRELKKFGGLNALILDDKNRSTWQRFWEIKKADGRPCAEVFICNYESLRKFFVSRIKREGRFTLRSVEFDERISLFRSIIIDESHKCKTSSTQQSKFVQGIAQGKEYVLELTGTPVVNNNIDLIQQLNIMGRLNDFGGYTKFMARYCAGEHKSSHLKELNYLLRKHCFVRRLKKDVLTQLPDKTRSYLVSDIDNRKEYKEAEKDIVKYLVKYQSADDEKIQRTIRGAIMVKMGLLKQISARGKVNGAIDIIHSIIDGADGQKLIVFCYLKEVVLQLKQEFRDAVTVTGDDDAQAKQYAVDRFQHDTKCRLIILNYKSGGVGLTLTAASNVLFVEFPWTAADCVQAEDRAHRNGQKNAVNCVYLLGQDTIDEYMYNLIQTKKTISDGVTGTDDGVEEHRIKESDLIFGAAVHLFGQK